MPFPIIPGGSPSSGYQVSRSLRFRSSASAYLSRTFGTATDSKKFYFACSVKRGALGSSQIFISSYNGSASDFAQIYFDATDHIVMSSASGGVTGANVTTSAVFRDPSAWYLVECLFDSTLTTAADRTQIWVNGVRQSVTGTTVPSNAIWHGNTAVVNNIARTPSAGNYADFYLAEINCVDGQSLTLPKCGAFDTNGVWQPARYTGSYGTNGFYLPFSLNTTSTYAGSFNGTSKYLTTPTSSNLALGSGDFTIEGWFNQTTQNNTGIVCQDYNTGIDIRTDESGTNRLGFYAGGTTFVYGTYSGAGQWHHFAVVRNGSGSNNLKLYLDGSLLCQTTNTTNFTGNQFRIGAVLTGSTTATSLTGSISNVRVVKGTAVYTAPFTPSSTALTAITNTQLLTLQDATIVDNSANNFTLTNTGTVTTSSATPFVANIASDASGQNNGWIPANINASSSGTTYDSMIDSPTNYADGGNGRGNYCTLNPINGAAAVHTVTNANLTFNGTSTTQVEEALGTFSINSGKWYWEVTVTNVGAGGWIGISPDNGIWRTASNAAAYGYFYVNSGQKYINNSGSAYGSSYTTNSVIAVAFDADNGAIYFGQISGGVTNWQNSGVPTSGSSKTGAISVSAVSYFPSVAFYGTSAVTNTTFGQIPFSGTVPSGYSALNTQNLPAPALTPSP